MRRLIICGSPRAVGRSSALAWALADAYRALGDEVEIVSIASVDIAPCTGCLVCENNKRTVGRDPLYCVIADSMIRVRALLNETEALTVISPVYFSGAPAQLKAFFDRLQPYYYAQMFDQKRPVDLFVVGEGGDPHGFGSLVGEARSALAVAGFRLERVHDWVGLIGVDGRLLDEAGALDGGRIFPASAYLMQTPTGVFPKTREAAGV
ncbi:flavodoxin family protein [Eggerthellaceae bacterium 3-80]|nr:flavodoxin family protein [bacterium D16-34]